MSQIKAISDPFPGADLPDDLEAAWRRIYERMVPLAVSNANQTNLLITPEDVRRLMRDEGADEVIEKIFGRGWDHGVALLGQDKPDDLGFFSVRPANAIRFLETYNIRLARTTSETTSDLLTAAIRENLEQGDTGGEAADRVRAVLDDYGPYQAQRVAATESTRAYEEGKVEVWKDSQIVSEKEWLLSPDPCALCVAIWTQRRRIPVTQPFFAYGETIQTADGPVTNDYADVNGGGAHPFCKCAAAPVIGD